MVQQKLIILVVNNDYVIKNPKFGWFFFLVTDNTANLSDVIFSLIIQNWIKKKKKKKNASKIYSYRYL